MAVAHLELGPDLVLLIVLPRTVMAWAGLRGAVSPAAAARLPERDLLVWLTLCVIFATLVLQGLTLPALIRALAIHQDEPAAHDAIRVRKGCGARITRCWMLSAGTRVPP